VVIVAGRQQDHVEARRAGVGGDGEAQRGAGEADRLGSASPGGWWDPGGVIKGTSL
jgi:hypothetical protein